MSNMHTIYIDVMTQEGYAALQELAFPQFDVQMVLSQSCQHQVQVFHVLFFCAAVDYDIIQVDLNTCVSQITKHICHYALKTTWGICQTHGKH